MKHIAYWISPRGETVPVDMDRHILLVYSNPEFFGLTKEWIDSVRAKYPKDPTDGYARQEILLRLLQEDWIRIRYVPNAYFFTVEYWGMTNRKKDYIWDWANKITSGEIDNVSKYIGVKLLDEKTQEATPTTLEDIIKSSLYESMRFNVRHHIKLLKVINRKINNE